MALEHAGTSDPGARFELPQGRPRRYPTLVLADRLTGSLLAIKPCVITRPAMPQARRSAASGAKSQWREIIGGAPKRFHAPRSSDPDVHPTSWSRYLGTQEAGTRRCHQLPMPMSVLVRSLASPSGQARSDLTKLGEVVSSWALEPTPSSAASACGALRCQRAAACVPRAAARRKPPADQ